MAIEALITDKTGKAIKDALTAIQQTIQQQGQGGQGGGVSIEVKTAPDALTTPLSQSVVYFLAPGTWTAFSPAVTVPPGKFGIAKYGTEWVVTVFGVYELASAISGMTAATSVELTDTLPLSSGEAATVQLIADAAEEQVLANADADGTGEDADLATVGSVKALIDGQEGKRVEPITSAPATLNQDVIYLVDNRNGSSAINIGTAAVPAGTTAYVYYNGTAWAVTVLGGEELASAIAAMTAADELTGDEVLPMDSGESVTVKQLAEFAEGVVGGNTAHVSGETADQSKLASVGKVQELIGAGRRVEPITSTPTALDQSVLYLIHDSSSDVTIGTVTVTAGTTAHVYHDGNSWVVADDGITLDTTIDSTNPSTTKAPTSAAVMKLLNEEYYEYGQVVKYSLLNNWADSNHWGSGKSFTIDGRTVEENEITSNPSNYVYSKNYIELPTNAKDYVYKSSHAANSNNGKLIFFDNNYEYISHVTSISGGGEVSASIPMGARYVKISFYASTGKPTLDNAMSLDCYVTIPSPRIVYVKHRIFDSMHKEALINLKYIKSNGEIGDSTSDKAYVTDYIPCANKRFVCSTRSSASNYPVIAFYDRNRNVVGIIKQSTSPYEYIGPITPPSYAYYMVVRYYNEGLNKESSYLYEYTQADSITSDDDVIKMMSCNHWRGKTIIAFGASGMQGLNAGSWKDYPHVAADRLGAIMFNYAAGIGTGPQRYYDMNLTGVTTYKDPPLSLTTTEMEAQLGNTPHFLNKSGRCWDDIFTKHENIDLCVFGDGDSGGDSCAFVFKHTSDDGDTYITITADDETSAKQKLIATEGSDHTSDTLVGDLVDYIVFPNPQDGDNATFGYKIPGDTAVGQSWTLEGRRDTYVGALLYLIQNLLKLHPKCRIVFTNDYLAVLTDGSIKFSPKPYVRKLANALNIRFIDFTDRLQINALNWRAWYGQDNDNNQTDREHPNTEGVERIANMFVHELLLIS